MLLACEHAESEGTVSRKKTIVVILLVVLVVAGLGSTQITVFVIQPIGAVPDGRTLVISRLNQGKLVDSADGMCERIQGSVNLLCRGLVLGQVGKNATVYARLPYSEALYLLSTNGSKYDR